ncbi:hypothetical protein [Ruegeria meonggei]|uniref:hypothetical protein n=1 Tax=Ruegeria meonggei TaxID=1446476 RepID=UPI0036708701
MSDKIQKIINAFYAAKRVDHYYWMHTDGDFGQVSIENIQRIIEILTSTKIEKFELDHDSRFHRAFVERFDEGRTSKIYVMASENPSWKRFSSVKEMCHVLIDEPGDFQPDPCKTIHELKDGAIIFDENAAPETESEGLAEIIAMELIYPLDYRREDREKLKEGISLEDIARERVVPAKYVSLGTSDTWFKSCLSIWQNLKSVEPENLDDYLK